MLDEEYTWKFCIIGMMNASRPTVSVKKMYAVLCRGSYDSSSHSMSKMVTFGMFRLLRENPCRQTAVPSRVYALSVERLAQRRRLLLTVPRQTVYTAVGVGWRGAGMGGMCSFRRVHLWQHARGLQVSALCAVLRGAGTGAVRSSDVGRFFFGGSVRVYLRAYLMQREMLACRDYFYCAVYWVGLRVYCIIVLWRALLQAIDADGDGKVGLSDYINFAARLKEIHGLQQMQVGGDHSDTLSQRTDDFE